jgi:hypothetical protein
MPRKKSLPLDPEQSKRFIEAARELGCDEDEDALKARMKRLAESKPAPLKSSLRSLARSLGRHRVTQCEHPRARVSSGDPPRRKRGPQRAPSRQQSEATAFVADQVAESLSGASLVPPHVLGSIQGGAQEHRRPRCQLASDRLHKLHYQDHGEHFAAMLVVHHISSRASASSVPILPSRQLGRCDLDILVQPRFPGESEIQDRASYREASKAARRFGNYMRPWVGIPVYGGNNRC